MTAREFGEDGPFLALLKQHPARHDSVASRAQSSDAFARGEVPEHFPPEVEPFARQLGALSASHGWKWVIPDTDPYVPSLRLVPFATLLREAAMNRNDATAAKVRQVSVEVLSDWAIERLGLTITELNLLVLDERKFQITLAHDLRDQNLPTDEESRSDHEKLRVGLGSIAVALQP